MSETTRLRSGLLVFPNLTQLDLTGPYEVLARLPGAETVLLWKNLDPVRSEHGLTILPMATLASCGPLDLILVPGGAGINPLLEDAEVLDFLRRAAAEARYVVGVCTGSLVLGAAGLLGGVTRRIGHVPRQERFMMIMDVGAGGGPEFPPSRREILKTTTAFMAAAGAVSASDAAQPVVTANQPRGNATNPGGSLQHKRMVGYMLAHEQFTLPELVNIGAWAKRAGFDLLATSDHLQPWQANEGHCGEAWVTLAAAGERTSPAWIGTTVTCPTLRYNPAVVAEAFASLSLLYPGRVFLGVGSGEALNEEAATGLWPKWPERWERLVEAIGIIRALWNGGQVAHRGKYYNIDAKLYDPPPQPIPLLTAANGRKSMRLAGQHGDGLITGPRTWKQYKSEWEGGARDAGKNHADIPGLVEQFVVVGD